MRVAARNPTEPFVLVALLGEGQEIHAGEEAGIGLWVEAVRGAQAWEVVTPPNYAAPFQQAGLPVRVEPLLNLTATLRSHRALQTANWVDLLLTGRLKEASHVAAALRSSEFPIYVARDLEALRSYCRDRYASDPGKRYGLLVSSKFREAAVHGIQVLRADYWYYGEWYEEGPSHPRSACRLELAATEFGCQGLELDLPIICWGPDLRWSGAGWVIQAGKSRHIKNPERIRTNAYRVLLTRGRDGLCLCVPPRPDLDLTYDALLTAGAVAFPG
jgi:hypothetical protein